ncbi:MAG TPA: hypothetical protein VM221_02890 [Armatimonadota bacterium]|nr:hypothetical protein [Armatimonadota bacterium]
MTRPQTGPRVLYRADGSPEIGTGHIIRGLILRRRLDAMGARVVFLTRDLRWGAQKLRDAGAEVLLLPADADDRAQSAAIRKAAPDGCVMDVLETPQALTAAARDAGAAVVCLDDVGSGRLNANAIINILEVEPAPEALVERGIALYQGPEYAALPEAYAEPGIAEREIPQKVCRILVTLGGADPAGLAPKAARALRSALADARAGWAFEDAHATLLVGSASGYRAQVMEAVRGAEASFTVSDSIPSLLPALRAADLGIIAGGLTMHEALAVGLPSIALCQPVRHQAELAQRFADQGAMLTLGPGAAVSEAQIADAVLALACAADRRRRLAGAGPRLVDGRGAQRTAEAILHAAAV